MSGLQMITLEKRMPSETQAPGVRLSRQWGLKVPRGPHKSSHPNYTWATLGNNCGGQTSRFPFRHWGKLLCAYWSPWPTFSLSHFCNRTVWMSHTLLFQLSSELQLQLCYFHTNFWLCQSVPHPFGEGYTEQAPCLCFHEYGALSFSPINWTKCKS